MRSASSALEGARLRAPRIAPRALVGRSASERIPPPAPATSRKLCSTSVLRQLPSAANGCAAELTTAANGVGHARSAWAIARRVLSVEPIAWMPSAQTMMPTARSGEIDARVGAQVLDIVERILQKAGNRAMITRRREYDAVCAPQGRDQRFGLGAALAIGGIIMRQSDRGARKHRGRRAQLRRSRQGKRQHTFRGRPDAKGSADAYDQGGPMFQRGSAVLQRQVRSIL